MTPRANGLQNEPLSQLNTQAAIEINQAAEDSSAKKRHLDDGTKARASKRSRKDILKVDPTTTLTADELKAMREGYGTRNKRTFREDDERRALQQAKVKATELLFGVPNAS